MDRGQLYAILWLRWRLTRNQWSRGGQFNAVITTVIAILGVIIGAVGGIGGLLLGVLALARASPLSLLFVWDGFILAFFFFWLIGLMSQIQRSEAIDIGKVLHLPVSLRGIFLVNYVASHVTLSIIVFVPWMVGLAMGLVLSRGWTMILLLPLMFGFLCTITAWTYYLRGWLVALMRNNPRRYHAMVAGITFVFILLCQLPNLLMNAGDRHRPRPHERVGQTSPELQPQVPTQTQEDRMSRGPPAIWVLHKALPPLWVGNGARTLAMGDAWPAVLGTVGTFALGGLGLGCAYRSTRRFYEGRDAGPRAKRKRRQTTTTIKAATFVERRLPGIPEEATATALAAFRSLTRATEVRTVLASSIPMVLLYGGMMFFSHRTPSANARPFYAAGAVLLPFFSMVQLLGNQFGFDRTGFRALVLSPTPRWQILLGKNLALLPLASGISLACLVLVGFALHIQPTVLLTAALQFLAAFFLLCMYGNLLSILFPVRIAPGSLKATKAPAGRVLIVALSSMLSVAVASPVLFPTILTLVLAPSHGLLTALMTLVLSAVELVVIVVLYRISLPYLGALLQNREKQILQTVTQEVE